MSRMTPDRSPTGNDDPTSAADAPRYVCPFCGAVNASAVGACPHCTMENTAAGRKATKTRIGPWYVLQRRNPAAPGMKFDTLLGFVRKGRIKSASVVRGPTTHQLWRFACQVKGLSREFNLCYSCATQITPTTALCPRCNRSQEPPARPDDFLENPEFAANSAAAAANVFRDIPRASNPSPMSEAAEEASLSPAQNAAQQAAHLQEMEDEHAAPIARVVSDLGDTSFGAIVSAHEADDSDQHTDLILPALEQPHGTSETDFVITPASMPDAAAASDAPRDDVPPERPAPALQSPTPVIARVTGGPRVVPRLTLPAQPVQAKAEAAKSTATRRGDRASVREEKLNLDQGPRTPATSPDALEGDVAGTDSASDVSMSAASTDPTLIVPRIQPRPGGSKMRMGMEAAAFLFAVGIVIFLGMLYVDPQLLAATRSFLHLDQLIGGAPSADSTSAMNNTATQKSKTGMTPLSATHIPNDPPQPVAPAAPPVIVSAPQPAPAAKIEAPPAVEPPIITETPHVAAPTTPSVTDTDAAVEKSRALWPSVFDAERAHDYAKAVSLLEEIQRLPRDAWPGALEVKLKADRARIQN